MAFKFKNGQSCLGKLGAKNKQRFNAKIVVLPFCHICHTLYAPDDRRDLKGEREL